MGKIKRSLNWQRAFALGWVTILLVLIWGANHSTLAKKIDLGERIPLLAFGIDAADASHHTDTLVFGILNPVKPNLGLISIPRDTRISLPGYRFRRINEIYGYHFRKTEDRTVAAQEVINGVVHLLSSEEHRLEIPYFFQVDYSGFRKIIDILGGIWVDIKHPMHYDDFAGNYHFHKDPGRYLLNGDEALHYVRYRGATGDRGRILRQQSFLRTMAKRFANPLVVFKFPQMFGAVLASVHTNLSFWDMIYMASASRRLRSNDLDFYILPGTPHGPYWRIKTVSAQNLAASLVQGEPVHELRTNIISPQAESIRVKVWNASGVKGLAHVVTRYLRQNNYDVVDWGNYPVRQIPTRIIDRTGRLDYAKAVAESLGVEGYHSEINTRVLADVEVVLGMNYRGVGVQKQGN